MKAAASGEIHCKINSWSLQLSLSVWVRAGQVPGHLSQLAQVSSDQESVCLW